MELEQLYGLAGIAVIAALIQAVKLTFPATPERYWPVVALALAVAFNLLLGWRLGADLWVAGIFGLVTGLAASGLYSQAKTYVGS